MILTTIFNFFGNMFIELFNVLPTLPNYSQDIKNVIQTFLDLIFQSGELILFFLPPLAICRTLINLMLGLEAFIIAYYVFMWVLKKIPIIDVK